MHRALIIDADAGIREILDFLFEHAGWEVASTPRTDLAVELAMSRPPSVLVTALRLDPYPVGELIQRVRGVPRCADVPVIVFTAASREAVRAALGDPLPPRVHLLFKGGDPRGVVEIAQRLVA